MFEDLRNPIIIEIQNKLIPLLEIQLRIEFYLKRGYIEEAFKNRPLKIKYKIYEYHNLSKENEIVPYNFSPESDDISPYLTKDNEIVPHYSKYKEIIPYEFLPKDKILQVFFCKFDQVIPTIS